MGEALLCVTPKREDVRFGDASGCVREVEKVVPLRSWALWDKRFQRYDYLKLFEAFGRSVASLAVVFVVCGRTEGCGHLLMVREASLWFQDVVGPPTLRFCPDGC